MIAARKLASKALTSTPLGQCPRAIVQGGPGSGKTTASVALFLELAEMSRHKRYQGSILPHKILHISGSWTRARAVQAALDLAPEVGLDGRDSMAAHTMTSFCAARLDSASRRQVSNASIWGGGDQVLHSRNQLKTLLERRLDDLFPPWVVDPADNAKRASASPSS